LKRTKELVKKTHLEVNADLFIPMSEIDFSYARSSGPGGQNVNKVNSKAVLRWNLVLSPSIGLELRGRLLMKLTSKLNSDGELILASDVFRDQPRNREDCLEKLAEMLRSAAVRPKNRRKTKPSYSSTLRAKNSKRMQSEKKKNRRGYE
jgi:ribosome-associated protein